MRLSPRRLATGLVCNVMLIYLLSPCQQSPEAAIDYYGVKREAEEIEQDSSAEFTLLNTVTHKLCLFFFSLPFSYAVMYLSLHSL